MNNWVIHPLDEVDALRVYLGLGRQTIIIFVDMLSRYLAFHLGKTAQ